MASPLDTYLDLLMSEATTLRAQHDDNKQWWENHQPSDCPVCIKEFDRLTRKLGTKTHSTCSHCGHTHYTTLKKSEQH